MDEVDPWMADEDGANCLLIAIGWSIELAHFVVIGVNLAATLCPTDTLTGLLLSQASRVASARRGLMIEGGATLRGEDILYRSVLLPLADGGTVVDHVLGATNYRVLRADEVGPAEVIFPIHWL